MIFDFYVRWWRQLYHDAPVHVVVETILVAVILYILLFKRAYDPSKRGYGARPAAGLTEKEKDDLIAEWEPEPLVSTREEEDAAPAPFDFIIKSFEPDSRSLLVRLDVESMPSASSTGLEGSKVTFCSSDYLGLGSAASVTAACNDTLSRYTVGSCGPRGFYGTTRLHLDCEASISRFMGTPDAITYSDSVATIASVLPAFVKRGDILCVDACVCLPVTMGAKLSRGKILTFAHNDMSALEATLQTVAASDVKAKGDSQRRFIVVEGLYTLTGELAPLGRILALAKQYKWRIILDDSNGIGVLGPTGRGSAEHAGLRTLDIDVTVGLLSTSFASVGGFCVGSEEVVDHQRLSGAGYCFSASAPPFLCATATAALAALSSDAGLATRLQTTSKRVHAALLRALPAGVRVTSDELSPVKHLVIPPAGRSRTDMDALLSRIVLAAARRGVLVTRMQLATGAQSPAYTSMHVIKLSVTLAHSQEQIDMLMTALPAAMRECGVGAA